MKFIAVASVPAQYHVPIYQGLSRRFGDDFLAIFRGSGHAHAHQKKDLAWNAVVHNDTGITTGYNHLVLDEGNTLHSPALALKLVRELQRFQPQAVLVNSHRDLMCKTAIETSRFIGANVVLRSTPYDLNTRNVFSHMTRELFLRFAYQPINGFAALGTLPRMHFEHFSGRPKAVHFSPYCTDEFFLKPLADKKAKLRKDFRTKYEIEPDEFVFLICGRLAPVKRIDWSLRAFKNIRKTHKVRLLIAGNGPSHSLVENAIADTPKDISWLGFQDRLGVARAMAAADALLLPSLTEPWGVVVNEALLFEIPIVASSNVASAVDLIQEGSTGFIFPVHDELAFYECVHDVFELVQAGLDKNAFHKLNQRFSAKKSVAGILAAARG